MSTQTGIHANSDLVAFFGQVRQEETKSKFRMMKVIIENEELALEEAKETQGDWERDWDKLVGSSVDCSEPCYILYRMDELDEAGSFKWLLICWSPDSSSVRNKMLYASTKATLKKDFGSGHICYDLYANCKEDVTLAGFKRQLSCDKAPQPLTKEEEERAEVKAAETTSDISVDTKHQTAGGLSFPMTKSAVEAVHQFKSGTVDYVQFSIDVQKEVVNFSKSGSLSIIDLPKNVPNDQPRYHLYKFAHSFEGADIQTNIFIYSMPGYDCSIKERMLYSSCRNALVDEIGLLGVTVDKKLEVDSGSELTEGNIFTEIHPKKETTKVAFGKPAPPSRGKRRMTKVPVSPNE